MNNKYFNDIYNDFFNVNSNQLKLDDGNNNDTDILVDIDALYVDNESKNLLRQIIDYIDKYANKEEKNYINFNIIIEGNDIENVNKICNILSKSVQDNHYINNKNVYQLSLYELSNKLDIKDIYEKNGIVILKDLKAFLLLDENNRKL